MNFARWWWKEIETIMLVKTQFRDGLVQSTLFELPMLPFI
jgi:hypothetical protein